MYTSTHHKHNKNSEWVNRHKIGSNTRIVTNIKWLHVVSYKRDKLVCIALACSVSSLLVLSFSGHVDAAVIRATRLHHWEDLAAGRTLETSLTSQICLLQLLQFPTVFSPPFLLIIPCFPFLAEAYIKTQKCLFVRWSVCPLGPICLGTGTLQCWSPEGLPQCPGPGG